MKVIVKEGAKYMLRLDDNEEMITKLQKFCRDQKIKAAYFQGIGAAKLLEFSFFDKKKKKFDSHYIGTHLDVASLMGNITISSHGVNVHAHGVFSDLNVVQVAGHIKRLIVDNTCEIVLESFHHKANRIHSKKIGMDLIQ